MNHEFHPEMIAWLRKAMAELDAAAAKLRKVRDERLAQLRADGEQLASLESQMADLRYLLREADPEHADEYAEPEQQSVSERERVLGEFRALIAFWVQHPDIPVPTYHSVYLHEHDGISPQLVDETAVSLGLPVHTSKDRRRVNVRFGTLELSLSAKLAPASAAAQPEQSVAVEAVTL